MVREITTPFTKEIAATLQAGDMVHLSGEIYTARDAAHKIFIDMLERGEKLPINLEDGIIYYVGPCPPPPGKIIGSAGPTTSSRMDAYTPKLLELGLTGMIGKGLRSPEVIESMKKNTAVYFGAIGGVASLISRTIVSQEIVCFPELGAEAVRKIVVKNFPSIVVIDSFGNNLYDIGKAKYKIV